MVEVLVAGEAHVLPPLPAWSLSLFAVAGVWWVGCFVGAVVARRLQTQRRLYWTGYGGAAALCGAALYPRGWEFSVWAVAVIGLSSTIWAFTRTGYLKVGGRLFTLSAADRRRDEQESGHEHSTERRRADS